MMYEIYQSVGGSHKLKPKNNNWVSCFFKGDRSWLHKGKQVGVNDEYSIVTGVNICSTRLFNMYLELNTLVSFYFQMLK